MDAEKLREKLFTQRPDLREFVGEPVRNPDPIRTLDAEVDDKDLSLSAWKAKAVPGVKINKNEVLSEEAIREMFSPRPLSKQPASGVGILRAVKKNSFLSDEEAEAKDFLVNDEEGLIGSQG